MEFIICSSICPNGVQRRFSHLRILRSKLIDEFPGLELPIFPEKKGSSIYLYLETLANNNYISQSRSLKMILDPLLVNDLDNALQEESPLQILSQQVKDMLLIKPKKEDFELISNLSKKIEEIYIPPEINISLLAEKFIRTGLKSSEALYQYIIHLKDAKSALLNASKFLTQAANSLEPLLEEARVFNNSKNRLPFLTKTSPLLDVALNKTKILTFEIGFIIRFVS